MNNVQVSTGEAQPGFFDFAAEVGLTKHIGGVAATEALVELCHIDQGSYVLDVGCGAGATACFLAKRVGCRVAGVDILEGMVARSRERAARERVADRVEFRAADAQDLLLRTAFSTRSSPSRSPPSRRTSSGRWMSTRG